MNWNLGISVLAAFALAACAPGGGSVPQSSRAAAALRQEPVIVSMKEETIGPAVDPVTHDVNPYGLAYASSSWGDIKAGDLVVCDFNDKQNVQGTGTSILHIGSTPGSKPHHLVNATSLEGCAALALSPDDTVWPADFTANNAPIVSNTGQILTLERSNIWHKPWAIAFSSNQTVPAFYVANAHSGDIVRIDLTHNTLTSIITGFAVNAGKAGRILGPSGLNYVASTDTLIVVDGQNNTLYAIDNVSTIPKDGLHVNDQSFSGPDASDGRVIHQGKPLNGPIGSALLPGGHIAVTNTLDPDGQNLIVEFLPNGDVDCIRNVDTGPARALFGMVAVGTTPYGTKVFFTDDNDNTLRVLTH